MSENPLYLTRRTALKTLAAAGLAASVPAGGAPGGEAAAPRPTLHVYPDYAWLRGFSMVPSWGARIEDAWWFYHGDRMREEVALARQVHANCIRLWIEYTAWFRDPDKVAANFLDAVAAIGEQGMKVMPCLFNRWHDSKYDYGGTYAENLRPGWTQPHEYVRALVTPLAGDPRILAWDLCNEPQAHDLNSDVNRREFDWLSGIAATVRACGARQPITVGTMNGGNIETYAPMADVLCGHPYDRTRDALRQRIAGYREIRQRLGKPLLVNETIPGAREDEVRAEVARYYTEQLAEAGFGWMGWALREGLAISTRRDRCDGNGINGVGFHPYFTKDGKLRDGLEFLADPPQRMPPWTKVGASNSSGPRTAPA